MTLSRKIKSRRGFSLAELLIVVAILAILGGIAFIFVNPADISHVEYNRSAESIAVAAQNHLTEIRNTGNMSLIREVGTQATPPSSGDVESTAEGEKIEAGGYRYVFSYTTEAGKTTGMSLILPFGAIDTELYKGYYALGFQSDTGIVGEAFYSPEPFKTASADYLKLLAGDSAKRKEEKVGYYQGTFDDKEIAFANLPTPQVTVTNFEELSLSIYLPKVQQLEDAGKGLGILISLSDKDGNAYADGLTLTDTAIYSTFSLGASAEGVLEAGTDDNTVISSQTVNSGKTYTLVLDTIKECLPTDISSALDNTTVEGAEEPSTAFGPKAKFEDWAKRSGAYKQKSKDEEGNDEDYYYLLGDNSVITVTVYALYKAGDANYSATDPVDPTYMPRSASVTFNGWFNNYGSETVDIACGRHLQNLNNLVQLKSKFKAYLPKVTKSVTEDGEIVYSYGDYNYGMGTIYTDGSSYGNPQISTGSVGEKYEYRDHVKHIRNANQINAIDFDCKEWKDGGKQIPFDPIFLRHDFKYYGNYLTITHLYVNAPFYAGLFGYTYRATLYDILLVNPTVTSQMPAHLSEIYEMGVGALVGTSRDCNHINNCQVYMTQEGGSATTKGTYNTSYRVTGECYVGGLIGFCEDEHIANCSASVYTGYQEGAKKKVAKATTPAEGGGAAATAMPVVETEEVNASSKYVGGLIGCITGDSTVDDCYAAGNLSGAYVGGLVGFIHEDSDPSGDDYRIETCYTAGHIEYASISASGILGHISELAGNAKSAVSVYGNYCAIIYGEGSGSTYTWNSKDANGNSVPIYGTFEGDNFEWLRTSDLDGLSDTYFTGKYAGDTFFGGAVFENDDKNYYVAQKGITYSYSSYCTEMAAQVKNFLTSIKGAGNSTEAIKEKIEEAQKKIHWLKKIQALEDMNRFMRQVIYEIDCETGIAEDDRPYNEGGYDNDSGKSGTDIYIDTNDAEIENAYSSSNDIKVTLVQAIHAIYDGTYSDGTTTKTISITDQSYKDYSDCTFMGFYNELKTLYGKMILNVDDTETLEKIKKICGKNENETYTVIEDGKPKEYPFYQEGVFYQTFGHNLFHKLLDRAKNYYENGSDMYGELIYRHFRDYSDGDFLELLCDLGMRHSERDKFVLGNKQTNLKEAIDTVSKFPTIAEKWKDTSDGKNHPMKEHAEEMKTLAEAAVTKMKALSEKLTTVEDPCLLEEEIKAADEVLQKLYKLLDEHKAGDDGADEEDYDVIDEEGNLGDMRKLRDPVLIYRRTVGLCAGTASSGVEKALDELHAKLGQSGADSSKLVEEFEKEVGLFLAADSGHRVTGQDSSGQKKSSENLRNLTRGYVNGVDKEREETLDFMYNYNNSSKNPYNSGSGNQYVDEDNGIYNNVFPYTENNYTHYYPFPLIYGRDVEDIHEKENKKRDPDYKPLRATYVLFHYGDWLTQDLWVDYESEEAVSETAYITAILNDATAAMDELSAELTSIISDAGNKGMTGNIKNQVNALTSAIDTCKTEVESAISSGKYVKAQLKVVQGKINEWLKNNGTFMQLYNACKDNKEVSAKIKSTLEIYKTQLETIKSNIDIFLGEQGG